MKTDSGSRFPRAADGNRLPLSVFALWLAFALFVLYAGTIPFHFSGDGVGDRLHHVSLNPLVSPDTGRRLSVPDVVQNVLLFLPFGVLGFLALTGRDRPLGPAEHPLRRIAIVTVLGIALSAIVEGLQLFTTDRVSSLGDILSNGAGTLAGAALAWQLRALVIAGLRRLTSEGLADVDELRPFAVATTVIAIAAWQPFDVTLELGTVASKVRGLESNLWQFSGVRDEGISIMLAALFAATLADYLSALGETRAARKAAIIGVVFVCGLEASQVLIGSRMPGLWDALVAAAGVVMGAVGWATWRRIEWPAFWVTGLVTATFIAVSLELLSPFVVAPEFRTFGWFPFFGYYARTTFETLSHVIELMLLYFPLGFCLAWLKGRSTRVLVTGLVTTFLIAATIEAAQGWIVGRYPDVTDVAVSLAGVWIGFHAYNRPRA